MEEKNTFENQEGYAQQEEKPTQKMKCSLNINGQTVYNILSALAILVLFILFFTKNKTHRDKQVTSSNVSILYVNVDSLMDKYDLVDTLENHLNLVKDSLQKILLNKQNVLQKKIADYQQRMQSGKITTKDEANRIERNLAAEQEALMKLNDEFNLQISKLQKELNDQILDSIQSMIKKYPEKYKASVLFGYTKGGGILYIDPSQDVTKEMIKDLNKKFNKR
jgi:outer membrane protein